MMKARCNAIATKLGPLSRAAALVCLAGCTEDAPPVPDLSGTWGRNYFDLEPPLSGPGPVANTVPDTNIGDYTNPILKPATADVVKKRGEIELSGRFFPTAHDQCWPEPAPSVLGVQLGVEVLQQRNEVILIYLSNHQVRRVRMNEPHRTRVTPSWQGDSVGYYEGDALIIDTVGQRVGPLSMVDSSGTPFSDQLHVIERYRLIDGETAREVQQKQESKSPGLAEELKGEYGRGDIDPDPQKRGLQVEITVEDPVMFTTRWSALVTYRRVLGEWPEAVCAENTREFGPPRNLPVDDTPDF